MPTHIVRLAGALGLGQNGAMDIPAEITRQQRMRAEAGGQVVDSILLNCHVPIDQNSFELRYAIKVRKLAKSIMLSLC